MIKEHGNTMYLRPVTLSLLALALALTSGASARAEEAAITPARLSFADGQVSFWRPGAEDWAPAHLNTPVVAGDALYTGDNSSLELQFGARAIARAAQRTQLGLVNQEPDFLQLQVSTGQASLDLGTLPSGHTIELDTPNGVFTIERAGYYRVQVAEDTTRFVTRRGGQATLTASGGEERHLVPSQEAVIRGTDNPVIDIGPASEPDDWDRWNYARSDHQFDAASSRYVPPGVYGADTLDHYGAWREEADYGHVWVPEHVAPEWVPYSTGSWVWDPYYGWTWVDEAPWGWAPFHYGRWVHLHHHWAWAPGPLVARPVYAPALVAFFGDVVSVHIRTGRPALGWVALGWGEPLCPWWGPRGYVGVPRWEGWGGPRIVNNTVVRNTTIVNNIINITYQNSKVRNAVVVVSDERFGRGPIQDRHLVRAAAHDELKPLRGELPVKPVAASVVPQTGHTIRPPAAALAKPVLATRPRRDIAHGIEPSHAPQARPVAAMPPLRLISPSRPTRVGSPFRLPEVERPQGAKEALQRPRARDKIAPGGPPATPDPQAGESPAGHTPPVSGTAGHEVDAPPPHQGGRPAFDEKGNHLERRGNDLPPRPRAGQTPPAAYTGQAPGPARQVPGAPPPPPPEDARAPRDARFEPRRNSAPIAVRTALPRQEQRPMERRFERQHPVGAPPPASPEYRAGPRGGAPEAPARTMPRTAPPPALRDAPRAEFHRERRETPPAAPNRAPVGHATEPPREQSHSAPPQAEHKPKHGPKQSAGDNPDDTGPKR